RNGKKTWRVAWRESGANGESRQRNETCYTLADARALRNKVETEIENNGVGDPEKRTVASYLKSWIARKESRRELSPRSVDGYSHYAVMVTPLVGKIVLAKLTAENLDYAYGELLKRGNRRGGPLKPGTVLNIHRFLHKALKDATG